MTYEEWFLNQAKLHKTIMNKLEDKSIDEIIEYFKYDNMKKNEPNFCPLYNLNKKCHEMEDLNCYLCACSYFRFNDKGLKDVDDAVSIQKVVQNLYQRTLYIMIALTV